MMYCMLLWCPARPAGRPARTGLYSACYCGAGWLDDILELVCVVVDGLLDEWYKGFGGCYMTSASCIVCVNLKNLSICLPKLFNYYYCCFQIVYYYYWQMSSSSPRLLFFPQHSWGSLLSNWANCVMIGSLTGWLRDHLVMVFCQAIYKQQIWSQSFACRYNVVGGWCA